VPPYIVDFICLEVNVIVELDGSQHLNNKPYDDERTEYLTNKGYQVIRFWNNEVLTDIEAVLNAILLRVTS